MTESSIIAADELRAFIERIEHQNAVIKDNTEVRKQIYAEAKGRGFDVKALRALIAMRKRKPDELAEEESVLEVYRSAVGV